MNKSSGETKYSPELKRQVLRLLQQNARMPVEEMGKRLEQEPEAVSEMIAEMEADRTIVGYGTFVKRKTCTRSSMWKLCLNGTAVSTVWHA